MLGHNRYLFLSIITLMGSVSLLSADIYLPALPSMALSLQCTKAEIQASFTLFLVGLAACQLAYGVLADSFGRKKITLFGLFLFILSSFFCATSTTLTEFLWFRLFQALGSGAGSVVVRAIVSDRFKKVEAAKVFSTIFPFIGLSTALGPFIGGHLNYFFGWQSIFYFMMFFGLLTFILVLFFLKETNKETLNLTPEFPYDSSESQQTVGEAVSKRIEKWTAYLAVFRNVNYLGYVAVLCCGFAAFRAYSVESPFVFDAQGYASLDMSSFYFMLSIAYVIGNLISKQLINKISFERVLSIGFVFSMLGGLCMVMGAFFFEKNPYAIIFPMSVIVLGNGFLFPMGSAGALSSVTSQVSGMASGLMGSIQFITAAFCSYWISVICQGQALWMSLFIVGIIFVGLCNYRLLVVRAKTETSLVS